MLKFLDTAIVVSLCLILGACASSNLSQQEVARDFWTAMAVKDFAKAKTYAKKGTMDGITSKNDSRLDKIDLKPVIEKNGLTVVPTTITANESGQDKAVSFNTVLERENGEWKVDFEKTTTSMMGFSMQEMMEGMGKTMGEAMKGVGEAVGNGLGGQVPPSQTPAVPAR